MLPGTAWDTSGGVNMHSWGGGLNYVAPAWPGLAMDDDGDGWFSTTVSVYEGLAFNLIFNAGGDQTGNLEGITSNDDLFYDVDADAWLSAKP